jgi:hypothetical protein
MACFSKGFSYQAKSLETGHHVYHTTGLEHEEIVDLCIRINSVEREPGTPKWPALSVPRISSTALTSTVAVPAV